MVVVSRWWNFSCLLVHVPCLLFLPIPCLNFVHFILLDVFQEIIVASKWYVGFPVCKGRSNKKIVKFLGLGMSSGHCKNWGKFSSVFGAFSDSLYVIFAVCYIGDFMCLVLSSLLVASFWCRLVRFFRCRLVSFKEMRKEVILLSLLCLFLELGFG